MTALDSFRSLPQMLRAACQREDDAREMVFEASAPGDAHPWVPKSNGSRWRQPELLAAWLLEGPLKLQRGDSIAILADTSAAWMSVDFAVLSSGGVTVGIYPTLTPEEVRYLLAHSEARAVFVDTEERARMVQGLVQDLPSLEHIVAVSRPCQRAWQAPAGVHDYLALLACGEALLRPDPGLVDRTIDSLSPDDRAALIYTSGTTGQPRGAILTHGNFLGVLAPSMEMLRIRPGSRALVFLPLAHVLQRATAYVGVQAGVIGYFARDIASVPEHLTQLGPETLASVPRMFEKVYAGIEARLATMPAPRRRMFRRFVGAARRNLAARRAGRRPALRDLALAWLGDRVAFSQVRARLGGAEAFYVGGAPMPTDLLRFFHALGLPVYEGYGLTETSCQVTVNVPADFRLGSVGKPVPGTQVRISDEGEIQVRGPGIFQGYFKNPEATARAFTEDGWFRTGDVGRLDADGFLFITGRIKELIITAGGKNVAPAPIEAALTAEPLIGQALVVGDRKPCLGALLAPDPDVWPEWCAERGIDPTLPAEGTLGPAHPVYQAAQRAVERANADLPRYARVRTFAVVAQGFSVESGELTPTLKLRRSVIADQRGAVIDALYQS